jgi:hypothetical protein
MNRLVRGPWRLGSFSTLSLFQTFEVIIIEPANGTTRSLQALGLQIDAPAVGDDYVATFRMQGLHGEL